MLRPRGLPSAQRLTAAAVREDDLAVLALQSTPGPLYAIETVPLAGTNGLDARVYRPRAQPSPVLVYFHGGGFVIGAAGYDRPLRDLARATGCLIECRRAARPGASVPGRC